MVSTQVSTRLRPELLARLDERRTVERRTRSAQLAIIVEDALADSEEKEGR